MTMEQKKRRTSDKGSAKDPSNDTQIKNMFRIFYMLRLIWKMNGHRVEELYKITHVNCTLYTKVIGMEPVDLSDRLPYLNDLTDIPIQFWDGQSTMELNSWSATEQNETWSKYISLRCAKTKAQKELTKEGKVEKIPKSAELINLEATIKQKIEVAMQKDNRIHEREFFKRLVYFAAYKRKQNQKDSDEILQQIEDDIQKVSRATMQNVPSDRLNSHCEKVTEYLRRVQATLILSSWDAQKNNFSSS